MFEHFFQNYPRATELEFDALTEQYYSQYYWPSNKLERALAKLYGWECHSLLFSLEDTPRNRLFYEKWCEKFAPDKKELPWLEGLLEQILFYAPDVLYFHEIWFYPKEFFTKIRFLLPGITILGWDCAPGTSHHAEKLVYVDRVFTCMEDKRQIFEQKGLNALNVGHFFEKNVASQEGVEEKLYDVVFAGTINRATSRGRVDMLKMLLAHGVKIKIFAKTDDEELQKYCIAPVYGNEFLETIQKAKIVLNQHVQENIKYSGNIRMYEVTGLGSLLLTDYREDLAKKFVADEEIVVYRSDEELLEKIEFYLKHEALREGIARKGKERTQRDYSYEKFAKIIKEFVDEVAQNPSLIRQKKRQLMQQHTDYPSLELSKNINTLLKRIAEINQMQKKVAIYGNGNISRLFKDYFENSVVVCDQNIPLDGLQEGLCHPLELEKYQFDYIVISVLGREKEIALYLQEKLQIPADKILSLFEGL